MMMLSDPRPFYLKSDEESETNSAVVLAIWLLAISLKPLAHPAHAFAGIPLGGMGELKAKS